MKEIAHSPAAAWRRKKFRAGLFLAAAYILSGILYFVHAPVPHVIALPLLLLSIASWWLLPWQMSLAMMFSFFGDLLGSMHCFSGQMASFAAAHVCMAICFAGRYAGNFNVSAPQPSGACGCRTVSVTSCHAGTVSYSIIISAAVLGIAVLSFLTVVPAVPQGFLKYGVSAYCIVISAMLLMALLQRNFLIAAGAVLFVFSDMILGWNRFVSPVRGADYLIMIPYYSGQLLLFIGTVPFKIR